MFELSLVNLLSWALTLFFIVGAVGNWRPSAQHIDDYRRWGYPDWFHNVTAILEFAAAILIFFPQTRIFGAVLGGVVMLAAVATLLKHGEPKPAIAPGVVALLTATAAILAANAL